MRPTSLSAPLLVLCLSLAACGDDTRDTPPESAVRTAGPLEVSLSLNREAYAPGDSVTMTLSVRNRSEDPVSRTFPTSQLYEFIIRRGETEVWRWSDNRAFAQAIMDRTFEPGETVTWTEAWDQRDRAGNPVPPEEYEAAGVLVGMDGIESPPLRFRIGK